jgi:hypothetical protein
VITFPNLPSLVFPGKNKVGYFLDRPRSVGIADQRDLLCTLRDGLRRHDMYNIYIPSFVKSGTGV